MKQILTPKSKHLVVNNVKVHIASEKEVKQFFKPSIKHGVGFAKIELTSKTSPPRKINYSRPRSKTPQTRSNSRTQSHPNHDPMTWNNYQHQNYLPWGICPSFQHLNQMQQMHRTFNANTYGPMRYWGPNV